MTRRRNGRCSGKRSRRGSVAVAVLGVSMIVTVIGLSALLAVRVELRATATTEAAVKARFHAQSVMDLALLRIAEDPNWRITYTHDTWVSAPLTDEVTARFKLADEQDGDLANDTTHRVRLFGQAVVGDAARVYSVLLEPRSPPNLMTNGDMEGGTTDWFGYDCVLDSRTDAPHTGGKYINVRNRLHTWAGPAHSLVGVLSNGTAYQVEIWARVSSGSARILPVIKTIGSSSGTRWLTGAATTVGTTWTRVAAALTPTWSGSLLDASVHWATESGTSAFKIDDAYLFALGTEAVLTPVPDTWRQELLP